MSIVPNNLFYCEKDVERLIKELRPWTIGTDKIVGYNHFDFVVANDVDKLVNSKILDLIRRYNH